MTFNIYSASVPVFVRNLEILSTLLTKGQTHAALHGQSEETLLEGRLAEDMFPLTRQVQIACDMAKFCGARLSGTQAPAMEDTETTFTQLHERIAATVAFLKSLKAEQFEGAESKTVEFSNKGGDFSFSGADYLLGFVYPNFFFHMTTTYDILRHKGVELGKKDFLGANDSQKRAA